jgi:acyl carrier protein
MEAVDRDTLKLELKQHIIKYLNFTGMNPDEIQDDAPLFGEGLGLDSIDSIELVVLLEREYGIKITDPKEGRKILVNVNTMAEFIEQNRTK